MFELSTLLTILGRDPTMICRNLLLCSIHVPHSEELHYVFNKQQEDGGVTCIQETAGGVSIYSDQWVYEWIDEWLNEWRDEWID